MVLTFLIMRQPLNLTGDTLRQAQSVLDRFYRNLKKNELVEIYSNPLEYLPESFLSALCDDLNTSKAIASMNEISKKLSLADECDKKELKTQLIGSGYVLGILQKKPDEWLGLNKANANVDKNLIEDLVSKRNIARNEKNFKKADQFRNTLNKMGIEIEDTPEGTVWRKIKK